MTRSPMTMSMLSTLLHWGWTTNSPAWGTTVHAGELSWEPAHRGAMGR
jgi:hypothetical protein